MFLARSAATGVVDAVFQLRGCRIIDWRQGQAKAFLDLGQPDTGGPRTAVGAYACLQISVHLRIIVTNEHVPNESNGESCP